jgi:hypothetical protein
MKKVILTLLLGIFVLCTSFAQTQIHIIGTKDQGDAVYWLNGSLTVLPKSGNQAWADAFAIAVSGSDVYIAGNDRSDAVYWLNGRRTVLSKSGNGAIAFAVAVSGSDVYIAGRDDVSVPASSERFAHSLSDAVYWLNGRRTVLPKSGNSASAIAIAVSGSDVHIAGNDAVTDPGNRERFSSSFSDAVYWLNGRRTVLPKSGDSAEATAIAVSGSDVYIVGKERSTGSQGYSVSDAVYWLNGRRTVLPKTGDSAEATAIAVSGSNVYIVGNDGNDAVYWLNGRRTLLHRSGSANVIAVSGSNVYIAGYEVANEMANPVYWLNGRRTILSSEYLHLRISGIAIVE